MTDLLPEVAALFDKWGTNRYDEQVSQLEHAVQCARLARDAGADDELIVAALLHDVGHLLELERQSGQVNLGRNDAHEASGAAYLARFFGPGVTAPIALHVEAKRYLCTVEESYFHSLSVGSVRSLEVQGGRMSPDEVEWFRSHPSAERAVTLRRWDEAGKDLAPSGVRLADFDSEVQRALR